MEKNTLINNIITLNNKINIKIKQNLKIYGMTLNYIESKHFKII